ncbi:MAG: branched-chain amino acid ABC transporter permease [Thermodesulfobacteriota bacterium]|nr:branched-chain amino acid ABC transporter permease [Thermodesulfobacteriota bacterium]
MRPNLRVVSIVSALLILVPLAMPSWVVFILTKALFTFIAVLGVALLLRGGQLTFGHALFFATGTYTVGFSVKWFGFRDALLLVPMGALTGLIMAALVGLIMARYRGVFFAMLNLAFSMILYAILLKFYWVTGGTDGISVGTATFLGFPLRAGTYPFYYLTLVIAGLITYVVYRFLASPLGYFLRAIADNEIRIEYSGESVRRVIYLTYILAGGLGGVSGVLAAFTVGHVVPEDAFWFQSGQFVFIALLGGFEGILGSLMGAVAFEFIQTYSSKYFPYAWQLTLGGIMLFIILFRPGGLWAIYESLVSRFSSKAEGSTHG